MTEPTECFEYLLRNTDWMTLPFSEAIPIELRNPALYTQKLSIHPRFATGMMSVVCSNDFKHCTGFLQFITELFYLGGLRNNTKKDCQKAEMEASCVAFFGFRFLRWFRISAERHVRALIIVYALTVVGRPEFISVDL